MQPIHRGCLDDRVNLWCMHTAFMWYLVGYMCTMISAVATTPKQRSTCSTLVEIVN